MVEYIPLVCIQFIYSFAKLTAKWDTQCLAAAAAVTSVMSDSDPSDLSFMVS